MFPLQSTVLEDPVATVLVSMIMVTQLLSPVNIFIHENIGTSFQSHCKMPLSEECRILSALWITGIWKREQLVSNYPAQNRCRLWVWEQSVVIFLFLWAALVEQRPPFAEPNWKQTQTKTTKTNSNPPLLSKNKLKCAHVSQLRSIDHSHWLLTLKNILSFLSAWSFLL